LAIVIYFRKDIKKIFLDLFKKDADNNLFWNLAIATIPAITIGFVFADFIESSLRDSLVVVSNLVSIGVLFIIAEKFSRKDKDIETLSLNNAFLIGLAQSAALIPGVSRSGITIAIALLLGLRREDAARFSFLLAIPATALASFKGVYDLVNSTEQIAGLEIYLTGLVVSAVAGFFVIKYLLKYLKNNSLKIFAYYRFILAIIFFIVITF
jgi:undecaprenyl-diphosphatase